MKKIREYSKWITPFFLLLILILVYKSLDNISSITNVLLNFFRVIKPFLVGFVIAYILNLPCVKIENALKKTKYNYLKKRSKGISIFLVYIISLALLMIIIRAIVPTVYANALDLYNNASLYLDKIIEYIDLWQERLNLKIITPESKMALEKAIEGYIKSINLSEFAKYAQGVISITSGVINVFISIIVSVYMLIDKELIAEKLKSVIAVFWSSNSAKIVCGYARKINDIFSKYVYCRLIDAVIIAVLSSFILNVLQVKYAMFLGIMIGFFNLIPYFGSIIGTIIAMIITLVTGGIFKALWTLTFLTVLEQIDGNYIGPKIMGDVLRVRPLWVIFAVTVGGGLFGILGMLLSVPVMVIIKMISEDYIQQKINTTDN